MAASVVALTSERRVRSIGKTIVTLALTALAVAAVFARLISRKR